MTKLRRRLSALGQPATSSDATQKEVSGSETITGSTVEKVAAYSPSREDAGDAGSGDQPVQDAAAPQADTSERQAPADAATVGEEVAAILKSAQDAAASIRRTAEEEADRVRREAEAAAASEIAEARRLAEAERTEASRLREGAETGAEEARAAAAKFAEQRRAEAESEAAGIISRAQARLETADSEVEQRVREATAAERQRIEALKVNAERYEKRLESILVVFRGMTSQLESLLHGGTTEESDAVEPSDDALEDALWPEASRSRPADRPDERPAASGLSTREG